MAHFGYIFLPEVEKLLKSCLFAYLCLSLIMSGGASPALLMFLNNFFFSLSMFSIVICEDSDQVCKTLVCCRVNHLHLSVSCPG